MDRANTSIILPSRLSRVRELDGDGQQAWKWHDVSSNGPTNKKTKKKNKKQKDNYHHLEMTWPAVFKEVAMVKMDGRGTRSSEKAAIALVVVVVVIVVVVVVVPPRPWVQG